jgi:hypothetical protein
MDATTIHPQSALANAVEKQALWELLKWNI